MNSSLEGTVERITYYSEADGYTVARLIPSGRRHQVTIVGRLLGISPGETLALEGQWREHREHGRQFEVQSYRSLMPATIDGIRRYLGSGLIKGIGPTTARKITEAFGKYTLDVLEREPERLAEVPGLGRKKAEQIRQAWQSQQQIKQVMLFLQELGLPTGLAVRIYKHYGDEAIGLVQCEPYRLAGEVYGIGFVTADQIAAGLGIPHDDPARIGAGLRYVLSAATEDGHCFLPREELLRRASSLLEVSHEQARAILDDPARRGEIDLVEFDGFGEPAVYLRPLGLAEHGLATSIRRVLQSPAPAGAFYRSANWPRVFAHLAERRDIRLSVRQQEALQTALCHKISLLTGSPGTGKTTCLRALIMLLEARGYRPLLAAPTGRAARRLAEATGAPAATIHRLLDYSPQQGGQFRRNAEWPLECDFLIIDEVSMLDVLLANHLLKALPAQAGLLLVGDADQLPSVGPGRVLADLIDSGMIPHVHLEEIFRQAAGSGIAHNARRINQGELPLFKEFADFFFFHAPEPESCSRLTIELVTERIPRRFGYDPRTAIQVLAPMNKGVAGVAGLNQALQAALNPPAPGKLERQYGNHSFRVGDRLMQIRNNYDLDVYNGDVGNITGIDLAGQQLSLRYEDQRSVVYTFDELDELAPAYCLSIHKSQGGEYPVVVIPLLMQHYALLQRNLLYTAVTRARELVVLVGDRRAIEMAVANNRTVERYTGLVERLAAAGRF